jgi:hypothetical protein
LKQRIFLKMAVIEMTSPQIRKVGAALTTMHARSLLAEASRFAERLGVPLALIHATTGEAESQAHLREAANQLTIPVEKHIVWSKSESAHAGRRSRRAKAVGQHSATRPYRTLFLLPLYGTL